MRDEVSEPAGVDPGSRNGEGERIGAVVRLFAVPLLPLVLAWDGLQVLWRRGLPAIGQAALRVLRWAVEPFRVAALVLWLLGRAVASSARILARAANDAAWLVWRAIRRSFQAIWTAFRPVLIRIGIAIQAGLGGLRGFAGVIKYLAVEVARRLLVPLRIAVRAVAHALRLVGAGVAGAFGRISLFMRAAARVAALGLRVFGRALREVLGRALLPVRAALGALLRSLRLISEPLARVIRRLTPLARRIAHVLRAAVAIPGRALRTCVVWVMFASRHAGHAIAAFARSVSALVRPALAPIGRMLAQCGRELRRAAVVTGRALAFVTRAFERLLAASWVALRSATGRVAAICRLVAVSARRVAGRIWLAGRTLSGALASAIGTAVQPLSRLVRLAWAALAGPAVTLGAAVWRTVVLLTSVVARLSARWVLAPIAALGQGLDKSAGDLRQTMGELRQSARKAVTALRRDVRDGLRRHERS